MKKLAGILVVLLCFLVISFPVLAQETKEGKAWSQTGKRSHKRASQAHVRSVKKRTAKRIKKGVTKKTLSTKRKAGKPRPARSKKMTPKSTHRVSSTE
jgi:hypothetical protein